MVCICPVKLWVSCGTNAALRSCPSGHRFLSPPSPVHPARTNVCWCTQCVTLLRAWLQQIEHDRSQQSALHVRTSRAARPHSHQCIQEKNLAVLPPCVPKGQGAPSPFAIQVGPQNSLLKLLLAMSRHRARRAHGGVFPAEGNCGGSS